jgi:predicted nucleotidyltransferase
MENDILTHLKEMLCPDAIILHGSRARGKERPHSDWDFVLLYNEQTEAKSGRLLYQNQNIEYSAITLPVLDIFETFSAKLQGAKVLYERNKEGTDLLQQANNFYSRGVHWTPEKIADHKLWVEGRINGMRDNIDNPFLFQKYFSDFYGRVFNYWYWLVANRHSEPIYVAVDEIKEKDPMYFEILGDMVDSSSSSDRRVQLADKISDYLFN